MVAAGASLGTRRFVGGQARRHVGAPPFGYSCRFQRQQRVGRPLQRHPAATTRTLRNSIAFKPVGVLVLRPQASDPLSRLTGSEPKSEFTRVKWQFGSHSEPKSEFTRVK